MISSSPDPFLGADLAPDFGQPSFRGDRAAAAQNFDLADRRELALVAVERSTMPMVVSDPNQHDNPIVLANQAFLDMTGYSAEEVVGKNCRFLQGPETDTQAVKSLHNIPTVSKDTLQVELLNYRKDGSSFWNQLSISAVHDEEGRLIYHFGCQKDVTARYRAEELEITEHRLLMEVDHRTMNALALVQSIVKLTRAETVAMLAKSISGRVNSIARAHRLLAQNGWAGNDVQQIIDDQMPAHLKPMIDANGPDIVMLPTVVQPFALILYELISNAQAHGALSGGPGRLRLLWRSDDGTTLNFDWYENGISSNQAKIAEKFGLNIVRNITERQLGGSLKIDTLDNELHLEFTIPSAVMQR